MINSRFGRGEYSCFHVHGVSRVDFFNFERYGDTNRKEAKVFLDVEESGTWFNVVVTDPFLETCQKNYKSPRKFEINRIFEFIILLPGSSVRLEKSQ